MVQEAVERGYIQRLDNNKTMPFQVNPDELETAFGVDWVETTSPGAPYPFLQYGGWRSRPIRFQVFMDEDITARYQKSQKPRVSLQQWITFMEELMPDPDSPAPPPRLLFVFGPFRATCEIENVEIRYTRFAPDLRPLRATAELTLRMVPVEGLGLRWVPKAGGENA